MTTTFKIYGSSDDLIEIEGQIEEELYATDIGYLAVYDGTLLKVTCDEAWHFQVVAVGHAYANFVHASDIDETAYSDEVHFTDITDPPKRWFMYAGARHNSPFVEIVR